MIIRSQGDCSPLGVGQQVIQFVLYPEQKEWPVTLKVLHGCFCCKTAFLAWSTRAADTRATLPHHSKLFRFLCRELAVPGTSPCTTFHQAFPEDFREGTAIHNDTRTRAVFQKANPFESD
jgi:phage-related protein